ncbi:MAG: M48 family metalloprotease [Woeseiaceae bacterium]
MNFFDAQDQARRATRRLVVAYIVATVLIVLGVTAIAAFALFISRTDNLAYSSGGFLAANAGLLTGIAILTTLFILGASLFKTAVLKSGGGRVAVEMGGTLVAADATDPLRRRLRNVVEEMAIASGVPVPEIYVLEEEMGINAFAAGYAPADAAVAVTRGTLELLDRDELQGVIAHEFSHILNGDMRLNIRLMGVLFGIMVLGLIGRMIVRGGYHSRALSSGKNRGAPVVLIVGLGLVVLGGIGVLSARIIKAGVSRQREFLADASAVQFTRQTNGIANALKKIGGFQGGSYLQATDPEEVSHMLFGTGSKLSGVLATHPPLLQRITALDPSFKASDFPHIDLRERREVREERSAGFAGEITTALAAGGAAISPESIADSVGQPDIEHVEFAQDLRRSIPDNLYDAAHSTELAYLLTVALVLDRSGKCADEQIDICKEKLGADRARIIAGYYKELANTGPEYRLPLLEISFPALKLRPEPQLQFLVNLTSRLIAVDNRVDIYEYCFHRVLEINLRQATDPAARRGQKKIARKDIQQAAINLLRIIADQGNNDASLADAAFAAGTGVFGDWATSGEAQLAPDNTIYILDHSLDRLQALNPSGQQTLLKAISAAVTHDGRLSPHEAELIRVVCATLNCPLPPILVFKQVQ